MPVYIVLCILCVRCRKEMCVHVYIVLCIVFDVGRSHPKACGLTTTVMPVQSLLSVSATQVPGDLT